MHSTAAPEDLVRKQLDKVLSSAGFVRNDRLTRFLRFVVTKQLEGKADELKESLVGIEVFGRAPGYDSKLDSVVRTEAAKLRARLAQYYAGEGAADPLVIEVPKGGYVPVIRLAPQVGTVSAPGPGSTPSRAIRRRLAQLALAGLAVVLATAGWMRFGPSRQTQMTKSLAYDLYIRGRAAERQRALTGVEVSIEIFEQAIAKDPMFAPAYAGIAAMLAARSAFDRFDPAERAEMIAKGWRFAEYAMRLDSRLPDAHDALAMMQAREAQWARAEISFRRAIELAPADPLWHDHFAMFLLLPLGRIEEAIAQLRSAQTLDPRSPQTHHALMLALRAAGRFADSDFHCQAAAENDQHMGECWAETLFRQKRPEDAVRILEEKLANRTLDVGAHILGVAYARAGRPRDAERMAELIPRPAGKALIFAALGDKDRTLDLLQQMVPLGATRIGRYLIAPEYAFLHGDPRLKELRRRVGLPE